MSLEPMVPANDLSWARSGARVSDACRIVMGRGKVFPFTVRLPTSMLPRAATRSYCFFSSADIRAFTVASAAMVPASSLIPSSFTVRRTSARSTLPATRASTSGSETGVRTVMLAFTGLAPSLR